MNILYHLSDVERVTSRNALERGMQYALSDRVVQFNVSPDGTHIAAKVHGSDRQPYTQQIQCKPFNGGVGLQGYCSCPMQFNCKHVAAALLHGLSQVGEIDFDAASEPELGVPLLQPREPVPQIDYQVRHWLDSLQPAAPARSEESNKQVLAFVLGRDPQGDTRLSLYTARPKKDGSLGSAQASARTVVEWLRSLPPYLTSEDVSLLEQLLPLAVRNDYHGVRFDGARAAALLPALLATRRCYWLKLSQGPLREAAPRPASAAWRIAQDGSQRMVLELTPRGELLPLAPPWYIDPVSGECGPVATGLTDALALKLAQAPKIQPQEVASVRAALTRAWGEAVPLPRPIEMQTVSDAQPVCHLLLRSLEGNAGHRRWAAEPVDLAELRFSYDGKFVDNYHVAELNVMAEDKLRRIRRNQKAEKAALNELVALGMTHPQLSHRMQEGKRIAHFAFAPSPSREEHPNDFWVRFMVHAVPQLRARGWQIDSDKSFRFNIASEAQWYALTEEQGSEWFDLELGVELDGQRVSLVPVISNLLVSITGRDAAKLDQVPDERVYLVPLPDGRLVPINMARLRPLAAVLIELFDRSGGKPRLRLSKYDAARLLELESALSLRWFSGERLRELGERLRAFTGLREVAPPSGLKAQLRPYQQQGLSWLQFLREYELAGILADDMGLGKTVQTLAHLLSEKESGRADVPSLVIAPTSLMYNWIAEASRFAPALRMLRLQGQGRQRDFDRMPEYDVVLSTYPLLGRDKEALLKQQFHYVILDEAQNIKNAKTQAAIIACQLKARHRLCLTGTPLENHLGELWSLFNFLMPGFLGREELFRELYRTPIEKQGNLGRQSGLAKRVAPFMLRRTKDQVAKELPAKTEIVRSVELSGAQRDLYETLRVAMNARVQEEISKKGLARSHIIILDALLKLRQACCDPRLVKLERAKAVKDSAKLEFLMALLPQLIEEKRKVLVFSQFTSMLALIENELNSAGISYSLLTGDTRDRGAQIEAFQNGANNVFLLSLKAGGTGLNLTAADTVIHYDPWWNPQVERQATDRAHRIGQDKPVFVYKLIAAGSVEEKIVALQEKKAALVKGVLEQDAAAMTSMSAADLQALFEPLV